MNSTTQPRRRMTLHSCAARRGRYTVCFSTAVKRRQVTGLRGAGCDRGTPHDCEVLWSDSGVTAARGGIYAGKSAGADTRLITGTRLVRFQRPLYSRVCRPTRRLAGMTHPAASGLQGRLIARPSARLAVERSAAGLWHPVFRRGATTVSPTGPVRDRGPANELRGTRCRARYVKPGDFAGSRRTRG